MGTANSFIGVGWQWPLALGATGGIAMVSGTSDVEQAMCLILSTTPGERPMRPQFGCRLAQFVFSPGNPSTINLIAAEVRAALLRWEPRVEVEDVVVRPEPDDASTLWITITYAVHSTNDRRNLVVPFYVIPDHGDVQPAPAVRNRVRR